MLKGYIIIAACKDECVTNLSEPVQGWFQRMGSKDIFKVQYRHSYAFIGFWGSKDKFNEKMARNKHDSVSVTQVVSVDA